mgnify:FL=1|tara:strand:+ start:2655 stop:2858 length:204 start_codon:yes stop_codon:yes gene_type:complete
MKSKMILKKFKEYIQIERERNKLMLEVSQQLGFDFTFSEEEMFDNAFEKAMYNFVESIKKEGEWWTK